MNQASREQLFATMCLIRAFEEKVIELVAARQIPGTVHGAVGQEAPAVGLCACLQEGDIVTSTHRGHGHFLAFTDDPDGLMAEIMGAATGCCGGWGGTQHLHARNFYSNGITGGMMPNAAGMALAEKLKKSGAVVLAFLGDGALGQGVVYEALNLAALWQLPLVFALEDNGYAMSTPTRDAVAGDMAARGAAFGLEVQEVLVETIDAVLAAGRRAVAAARAFRPQLLVLHTYRFCGHSRSDDLCYRSREEEELWRRRDPLPRLAAELGEARSAALRARAAERVAQAVRRAQAAPRPTGEDVERLALEPKLSFGPEEPGWAETTIALPSDSEETARLPTHARTISLELEARMRRDARIVLLGEDIAEPYGGAFKITKGLSEKFPGRVIPTPVSEAALVGVGAGMALRGLRPIVEIMFGDFVTLCADQIVNHAAKFRAMYGGKVTVPLVIRAPMGGRRGYGPTHSQSLENLFLTVPGLTVAATSHLHDARSILARAVADENPVLLLENKLLYGRPQLKPRTTEMEEWAIRHYYDSRGWPVVALSNAEFEETQIVILTYGGMLPLVMEAAAEALGKYDIFSEIVAPSRLSAVETEILANALSRCQAVLIAEEGTAQWGWGAEWAARLFGEGGIHNVDRIGAKRTVIGGSREIEQAVLPSAAAILGKIIALASAR